MPSSDRPARRSWPTALEALAWLAVARLAVVLLPFARLAPRLGTHMHESVEHDSAGAADAVHRVRWAIAAAGRRAPWRCKCLEQAIAAKAMLRRRGMPSTLYLGVARAPTTSAVQAHAWLRCGSHYVTGGGTRAAYTVVSTFGDLSPASG